VVAGVELDAGRLLCGDGAEDCGAGDGATGVVAGVFLGEDLDVWCNTEPPCSTALSVRIIKARAQIMNMMAHHVVA